MPCAKNSGCLILTQYSRLMVSLIGIMALFSGCTGVQSVGEYGSSFLASGVLLTGSFEVVGIVIDADTGRAIRDAQVSIAINGMRSTDTDSLGHFTVKCLGYEQMVRTYQLVVSKKRYQTRMDMYTNVDAGTIRLKRKI